MGIKNMHTFLRKSFPSLYEEVHLSEYQFKKIAIDTAIYLCKFKTSLGENWLSGFVQLCSVLRYYGIHPVFIFDNVFPPEKDEEKKRRSDARKQQRQRLVQLQDMWAAHKQTLVEGVDEPKQYCSLDDPNIPINLYSFLFKTFISTDSHTDEKGQKVAFRDVDNEFKRMENTLLVISPEDHDMIRSVLMVMKIPWVIAIGEAEAMASYMCHEGIVDAVLTDDTDVLAYSAPLFLHRVNLQDHTCIRIRHSHVLEMLQMTPNQFIDFCILCGTDYNLNLPGIGSERAYRMIRQMGCIESILQTYPHLDPDGMFPFKRVREMFTMRPDLTGYVDSSSLLSDFPDWKSIVQFMTDRGIHHHIDMYELEEHLMTNTSVVFPDRSNNHYRSSQSLLRPTATIR